MFFYFVNLPWIKGGHGVLKYPGRTPGTTGEVDAGCLGITQAGYPATGREASSSAFRDVRSAMVMVMPGNPGSDRVKTLEHQVECCSTVNLFPGSCRKTSIRWTTRFDLPDRPAEYPFPQGPDSPCKRTGYKNPGPSLCFSLFLARNLLLSISGAGLKGHGRMTGGRK